ncbi:hypothetical protein AB0D32_15735 [Micromonospora sp. NPDC048170]|uniref:hypothetical protein n=1 Tax=Micromonospora sp. NPDC048170 TaxID=3154819 RepID=UPI0033FD4A39
MLLRVRVTLPDRPGTLGQVARTMGISGADIVQVVVLERLGGRAVDDFTVVWPGAARVEQLLAGLAAIPGVRVDGVWRAIGAPTTSGQDAELLAQVAANPVEGVATLVDAVPGLLAADWAVATVVPVDWASRTGTAGETTVGYASWRAPVPLPLPEVTPLRARAISASGGHFAVAPFGRAGLVLVVAPPVRRNAGRGGVPRHGGGPAGAARPGRRGDPRRPARPGRGTAGGREPLSRAGRAAASVAQVAEAEPEPSPAGNRPATATDEGRTGEGSEL